ncbi:hypothetical protein [Variovorax sp. JS1663]|uniref:hypothetical protein n=1 Tax=Variovorax sp. JS1663 TaxID=1851577 RepID=UPI000B34730F|nr:hypothetical protein [Variovorax sp. JS1663]OUM01763.1 hypothetical protein A8M77_14470 [Variovorax sp. JS1663]
MAKRTTAPEASTGAAAETAETAADDSQPSQIHTYPDGSAVNGCPPWPEKSPLQRQRATAEGKD